MEVTRLLLGRGAVVNVQEEDGPTLLHPASFRGHAEVVRMLLVHGAGVSAQNALRLTPSSWRPEAETWSSFGSCSSAGRTGGPARGWVFYIWRRGGAVHGCLRAIGAWGCGRDGLGWGRVDSV